MTIPSQRGERWTIYVCEAGCGAWEDESNIIGFDDPRCAIGRHSEGPPRMVPVEVIPLSAVQALAEELETSARRNEANAKADFKRDWNSAIGAKARAYAVAYRHAARRLREIEGKS